jgi:hypothetical protein
MSLALSIIIVVLGLLTFVICLSILFAKIDGRYPTQSIAPTLPKKTIEGVIKEALKNPPLGCMWEVKKVIKTYRRSGGVLIFDGTADMTFAEFKFITPFASIRSEFSLQIKDPVLFEQELRNHVQKSIDSYNKIMIESADKSENDEGWDGLYH